MNDEKRELITQVLMGMDRARKIHHPRGGCNISNLETYTMMYLLRTKQKRKEQINVSLLAEKTNVSMQSVSRTLKNLEAKGYIRREVDRNNRRNTLISLSEEGEKVLTFERERMDEYFYRIFSHFTNEELRSFISLQNKLCTAVLEEEEKLKDGKKAGKEN